MATLGPKSEWLVEAMPGTVPRQLSSEEHLPQFQPHFAQRTKEAPAGLEGRNLVRCLYSKDSTGLQFYTHSGSVSELWNKTGAGSVGVLIVGSLSGEAYPQALSLVAKEIKVGISSWSWASSG